MGHHGRGLFQLIKDKTLVDAIKNDYRKAELSHKDRLMLEYSAKLTSEPCDMKESDVVKLRKAGFEDSDLLDIVQVVAYYNYVNRLACGLGVELEEYWEEKKGEARKK